MRKLLLNRIQCNSCNDVVTSHFIHDFNICKCGNVGIDGGLDYSKRTVGYSYNDLCVYDDGKFETQRQYFEWGKWTGAYYEHIPIKDLEFEHIWNILLTQYHISKEYRRCFEDELLFRMGEKVE